MKKIFEIAFTGVLAALAVSACEDWKTPEAKNYEPDGVAGSDRDEAYYAALREWKAARTVDENGVTSRSVTFGWFSDWSGVGASMANQLMGLPDSVDFVSMWGNWYDLSDDKKEDLRKVQEIKGTKVLMCFIVDNVGVQTTPAEVDEDFTVNGVKYESLEEARGAYWGWYEADGKTYGSADNMEVAIRKYAQSIIDTMNVYNWDGFDFDLEPNYGHGGNISSYPDRISIFLDELSTVCGPKSGTERMLVVDGEPYELNASDADKLDYFILQAYTDWRYYSIDKRLKNLFDAFPDMSKEAIVSRTILCSNFESYGSTGGYSAYGDEYSFYLEHERNYNNWNNMDYWCDSQIKAYAQYQYPDVDQRIGGIGAYRFIFDTDYTYFRKAMKVLHSPLETSEDEETTE